MSEQDIHHDADKHRFILTADGSEALLEYQLVGDKAVDFTYTYVPPEYRGKGLAEALVRYGLAWARQQNYQISASCWYVAKFLR